MSTDSISVRNLETKSSSAEAASIGEEHPQAPLNSSDGAQESQTLKETETEDDVKSETSTSSSETTTADSEIPKDSIWFRNGHLVIICAAAQLIMAENEKARQNNGEQVKLGKTFELGGENARLLFHQWNLVRANTVSEMYPDMSNKGLPPEFRVASPSEQQKMSFQRFAEMVEKGEADDWLNFDLQKLYEESSDARGEYLDVELGDVCNFKCFYRKGHTCTFGVCSESDRTLMMALMYFERVGADLETIREALDKKEPDLRRVINELGGTEFQFKFGMEDLHMGIEKERTRRKAKQWASEQRYWAMERGEEVPLEYQEGLEPESHWTKDIYSHIIDTHTEQDMFYNTTLILAAGGIDPPSDMEKFGELWRMTDAQKAMCARAIEDAIELKQAVFLSRASWAPQFLRNSIFWLHNDWAKESSVPDSRLPPGFRDCTPEKRRKLSYECCGQAIALLNAQTLFRFGRDDVADTLRDPMLMMKANFYDRHRQHKSLPRLTERLPPGYCDVPESERETGRQLDHQCNPTPHQLDEKQIMEINSRRRVD